MFLSIGSLRKGNSVTPKPRLTREQRRSLELLASDPRGATGDRLVIAHGFETKMLAGLDHEGLAIAIIGEGMETGGKTVEVVRISITESGRRALAG
jgi:hypothetical protein